MSSLKFNFAMALYKARTARGWTQAQAAEILDCSVRYYQMMEAGQYFPSFPRAVKIAKFFAIDISTLTDEELPFYV